MLNVPRYSLFAHSYLVQFNLPFRRRKFFPCLIETWVVWIVRGCTSDALYLRFCLTMVLVIGEVGQDPDLKKRGEERL